MPAHGAAKRSDETGTGCADNDALGDTWPAVALFGRRITAPHDRIEDNPAIDRACIRVNQQLCGIEAVSTGRIERSLRTQSVASPDLDIGDERMKDVAGALGKRDPLRFALPVPIEQAEFDRRGVRGEHRHVRTTAQRRHP